MAINKKLIHFKTFENFNSQKLSANEENTKYTLGIDGEVLNGTPDILYQSIVWIKDAQKQWTHGQLYDGSSDTYTTGITINGETKNPSNGDVDLGYINKQLSTSTSSSMALSPNIYYRNTSTALSTLTITLASASNSNIINEYFVEFTTSSSGTTVSLPSTIKWANGEIPTFEARTTYQISIVNNLGVVTKFE